MNVRGKHPLLVALAVIVLAESVLLAVATVVLAVELLAGAASSFASAVALAVLTALAAGWLGTVAVNVLRGQSWVRGAVLTWQVLQGAVAVGAFQGYYARPDVGWLLLLPAVAAVVLLFTRPVLAATARPH